MDISKLIKDIMTGYNAYLFYCDVLAREAQKYIDFDNNVSCEYVPGAGVSILATVPCDCSTGGMSKCACSAKFFFAFMEGKETITSQVFKAISI